jgi:hypothetical protein
MPRPIKVELSPGQWSPANKDQRRAIKLWIRYADHARPGWEDMPDSGPNRLSLLQHPDSLYRVGHWIITNMRTGNSRQWFTTPAQTATPAAAAAAPSRRSDVTFEIGVSQRWVRPTPEQDRAIRAFVDSPDRDYEWWHESRNPPVEIHHGMEVSRWRIRQAGSPHWRPWRMITSDGSVMGP